MIKIKIVGVGGAGGNTVSRLFKHKIEGVESIVINTDVQDLKRAKANYKIQIGKNTTKGFGTGMRLENGEKAARENQEEIKEALKNTDMVFIAGGLGGGTFSGAGPLIAEMAKNQGALTIAIVIKPFSFEGAGRINIAKKALNSLENKVDALIVVSNDKLVKLADNKTTIDCSFALGDKILKEAILGICELILRPGIISVDFASVKNILKNSGKALISQGEAAGENRAVKAAKKALFSPLLNFSLKKPKGILFNISAKKLSLTEIKEAADTICQNIDPGAKIVFGAREDDKIKPNLLKIMLIATGIN